MTVYRIQSVLFETSVEKLRDDLDFDIEGSGGSKERIQTKSGKLTVNGQEQTGLKVKRLLATPIFYFYADQATSRAIDSLLVCRVEHPSGAYEDAMRSLGRFAEIQSGEKEASQWTLGRRFENFGSGGWTEYFTNNFRS